MAIKVGSTSLTVTTLGRFVVAGNIGTQTLKLVQSSGADLPGGTASVAVGPSLAGQYAYFSLPSPVTLNANTTYYLVSQRTAGSDFWYDLEPVTCTSAAQIPGAVYTDAQGN